MKTSIFKRLCIVLLVAMTALSGQTLFAKELDPPTKSFKKALEGPSNDLWYECEFSDEDAIRVKDAKSFCKRNHLQFRNIKEKIIEKKGVKDTYICYCEFFDEHRGQRNVTYTDDYEVIFRHGMFGKVGFDGYYRATICVKPAHLVSYEKKKQEYFIKNAVPGEKAGTYVIDFQPVSWVCPSILGSHSTSEYKSILLNRMRESGHDAFGVSWIPLNLNDSRRLLNCFGSSNNWNGLYLVENPQKGETAGCNGEMFHTHMRFALAEPDGYSNIRFFNDFLRTLETGSQEAVKNIIVRHPELKAFIECKPEEVGDRIKKRLEEKKYSSKEEVRELLALMPQEATSQECFYKRIWWGIPERSDDAFDQSDFHVFFNCYSTHTNIPFDAEYRDKELFFRIATPADIEYFLRLLPDQAHSSKVREWYSDGTFSGFYSFLKKEMRQAVSLMESACDDVMNGKPFYSNTTDFRTYPKIADPKERLCFSYQKNVWRDMADFVNRSDAFDLESKRMAEDVCNWITLTSMAEKSCKWKDELKYYIEFSVSRGHQFTSIERSAEKLFQNARRLAKDNPKFSKYEDFCKTAQKEFISGVQAYYDGKIEAAIRHGLYVRRGEDRRNSSSYSTNSSQPKRGEDCYSCNVNIRFRDGSTPAYEEITFEVGDHRLFGGNTYTAKVDKDGNAVLSWPKDDDAFVFSISIPFSLGHHYDYKMTELNLKSGGSYSLCVEDHVK